MKKVVLVDFDGVVLRNKIASQYVTSRIKTYVERKLKTNNKTIIDMFSDKIYRDHGHTEYGMAKHGYKTSLAEFNYHVYDSYDAKMQYNQIQMTKDEVGEWYKFKEVCDARGADVLIFSNAPTNWIRNFIPDEDKKTLVLSEHLESFRHLSDDNILKPSKTIRSIVTNFVKEKDYTEAFFIDDNLNNLSMVASNPYYTRVWFNSTIDSTVLLNSDFYAINKLDQMNDIL
jgi:FMN phosphatase YigB (HAD superfamily)